MRRVVGARPPDGADSWGRRIRTPATGARTRRPTARRSPTAGGADDGTKRPPGRFNPSRPCSGVVEEVPLRRPRSLLGLDLARLGSGWGAVAGHLVVGGLVLRQGSLEPTSELLGALEIGRRAQHRKALPADLEVLRRDLGLLPPPRELGEVEVGEADLEGHLQACERLERVPQ